MKEEVAKYIFTTLVGIIGFFIVKSYNTVSLQLAKLNEDMLNVKLTLVEMQKSMITEEKVREIIELEMMKHGIK